MVTRRALLLAATATLGFAPSVTHAADVPGVSRSLTFEERVAAQKAIEQVYWNHRIWPKENPGPKPPLSAVMSDDAIRAKVEDYLKQSNALKKWWRRPITGDQLQAEMDRMAHDTRDSGVLRELYDALGNDPTLVAETLARQTLVERLLRTWYAKDERFHGELKRKAEAALAACGDADCMKSMDGLYHETTWKLRSAEDTPTGGETGDGAVILDDDAWKANLAQLGQALDCAPSMLPIRTLGRLEETHDAFAVITVLSQSKDEVATAVEAWPKQSFDKWWAEERDSVETRIAGLAGAFELSAPTVANCVGDTWRHRSGPDPRFNHSGVWTGTEMIVWGGNNSNYLNTGGRYNPSTDTWVETSVGTNVPAARSVHTAVWTGTEMIVWGGYDGNYLNTGGRYNPATNTWLGTSVAANVPDAREYHTAVWTSVGMIVWGGYNGNFLNTGGRYNPSTDTWLGTSVAADVPDAREYQTAIWTGTEMVVWGGYNGSYLNTGGRYRPSTDTWVGTSVGANAPAARYVHTAVWTGGELIVWGGYNGNYLNTGGRYNPFTDTWLGTSVAANVPAGRTRHTAVWSGTEMIVWGGHDTSGNLLNPGGRYSPSTDTWVEMPLGSNGSDARQRHSAVWTGTEMIVWGGDDASNYLATGGRYDPSTDSWVQTLSDSNVLDSRAYHTAVWTGTEMIVWGGYKSGYLNTGVRYNPTADTWLPTSTGANVPDARRYHKAVWTGTEMIVWGGANSGNYLNTGGRYNPSTNTWAATSVNANVPAARAGHTAVWTGTEMIVWGGYNGNYQNTGGRYNPSSDTWVGTSVVANVPAARSVHTAVWTGTEMVVWGGDDGNYLNTGYRYNPSTDTWLGTSVAANVPDAREFHTAAWTGTEMIVWGGNDSHYIYDSGGRYNPSTDTWLPTSSGANVPDARTHHTAVWTGTEMIVWGGSGFPSYLNTGFRYNPSTDTWLPTSTGANVPDARADHTAVWTGREMIVWGGGTPALLAVGGTYCECSDTSYRDADGDLHGNPSVYTVTCDGSIPAGFVADNTDCNDTDGSVHPGVPETICNGIDESCLGDDGYPAGCMCAQRGTGLVGWFQAEGNATNQTGGSDGTAMGSTAFAPGEVGQAFAFDGSGWVQLPDAAAFEFTTQMTLEAWIRPTAGAFHNYGQIVNKWGAAGSWAYSLSLGYSDTVRVDISGDGSLSGYDVLGAPDGTLSADTWTHVAATFNAGTLRLYVNGSVVASKTSTTTALYANGPTLLNIGRSSDGGQYFTGRIDEVGLYNRALSSLEIRAIYEAGAAGMCPCRDGDRDGYGAQAGVVCYGGTLQDCIDANSAIHPGAPELCNGVDENCNGQFDDGLPQSTFYRDADNDGYGNVSVNVSSCAAPSGYVANAADCNDTISAIHPGVPDASCNGIDNNCNGQIDEEFVSLPDGWFNTGASGAPSDRAFAAAASTGSKVVVWSGGSTNTGGTYDPSSGVWTAMTTTGAPSARDQATAVWSGTEVLFWGGKLSSTYLNDGGRYNPSLDQWQSIPSSGAGIVGRTDHTAVWTGSKMIVWGGRNGSAALNSGGVYDPVSNAWSPVQTSGVPSPRFNHTAVWTGSRMIVWGGENASGTLFDDGRMYNPSTNSWTAIAAAPLGFTTKHTAVWTGSKMIIWGGVDQSGTATDWGAAYDPVANTWEGVGIGLSPRYGHVAVWDATRNQMIVWGGADYQGLLLNDGAVYDVATMTSSAMPAGAPSKRSSFVGQWVANTSTFVVWGGNTQSGTPVGFGGRFVPSSYACGVGACVRQSGSLCAGGSIGYNCTPGAPTAETCNGIDDNCNGQFDDGFSQSPFYRDADGDGYGSPSVTVPSCAAPAGYVANQADCNDADPAIKPGVPDAICNGMDDNCSGQADEQYASVATGWLPTATSGEPTSQYGYAAAGTGSIAIVWGGVDPNSGVVTNTGARYDPATNTWTPTAITAFTPTARQNASAVWSGSLMLVWGGLDDLLLPVNGGGRYNPTTDSWSTIPATGLVTARVYHSAVLAGSRMIVWGGIDTSGIAVNTGGIYDTSTGWSSSITTTGAPSARFNHTAVWTGSKMIVWGGETSAGVQLNDGKIYDPATNVWSAMAASGTAARTRHTAVWTGSKMIIWGGYNSALPALQAGAAYDPASNTWSGLTAVGPPPARSSHSAVWDSADGLMIVWGGVDIDGMSLYDGGRYNPSTLAWSPVTTTGAPTVGSAPIAAWVGSLPGMVVWGGSSFGGASTGGRYIVTPMSCGVGGCVRQSGSTCGGGVVGYSCIPGAPAAEVCNGIDDNCDGPIDDGAPPPSGTPLVSETNAGGSTVSVSWAAIPFAATYDIVTGSLGSLRSSLGDFTTSTTACLGNDLPGTNVSDSGVLAPGTGVWHLVRAVSTCGGSGTYDEAATSQAGTRDGEIAASASACP